MTAKLEGCVTCALADWERTPTGRIKANTPGRCRAVSVDPRTIVPSCMVVRMDRVAIWPGDGLKCPARIQAYNTRDNNRGG